MRALILGIAVCSVACAELPLGLGMACSSDSDCDPGDSCTSGSCGADLHASPFSVTPATANVSTQVGAAPEARTFSLADSTSSGHAFTVACDGGAVASPASGHVSKTFSAAISVQAPAPTAVGLVSHLCKITSKTATSAAASFSLDVSALQPVEFSLVPAASELQLATGASGTVAVQVVGQGGFSGAVSLSVSGLPAHASASFSPAQVQAGGTSVLTVDAGTASTGSWTITLSGTDGGTLRGAPLSLVIGAGGSGGVGPGGGTVDLLDFVATGDTRPPVCDDTAHYPAAVHAQIVQAMAAVKPQFAVDLGDHMYVCSKNLSIAQAQMNLYVQGLSGFAAPFFMTMGNHECQLGKDCSANPSDVNYQAFLSALKSVSQQDKPNYALQLQTRLGRATVVVVADNSLSSADQAWLQSTLADADANSKYTIIAKHHPVVGTRTSNLVAWNIIKTHKYSLMLMAHNHDYEHTGSSIANARQVICGLGGANSGHTGFCRVQQQADATLRFTQYDAHGNPGDSWAVAPQ